MKASMMGDVHSGNGDQGTLADIKRYSSRKLEDSEGREIRGQPRNLDIPQDVLSGATQVFELHICDLNIIEADLDCLAALSAPLRMSQILGAASPSVMSGRGARSKEIPGRCMSSHFSLCPDCLFTKSRSDLGSCAYEPPRSSSPVLAANLGTILVVIASRVSETPGTSWPTGFTVSLGNMGMDAPLC